MYFAALRRFRLPADMAACLFLSRSAGNDSGWVAQHCASTCPGFLHAEHTAPTVLCAANPSTLVACGLVDGGGGRGVRGRSGHCLAICPICLQWLHSRMSCVGIGRVPRRSRTSLAPPSLSSMARYVWTPLRRPLHSTLLLFELRLRLKTQLLHKCAQHIHKHIHMSAQHMDEASFI